jgi:hypothetical protein
MRVCIGLIMFPTYFYHSLLQVASNCALIKVDWLAACIALRVVGAVFVVVPRRWHKINLHNPPANGKQGLIPEEKSPNPADQ